MTLKWFTYFVLFFSSLHLYAQELKQQISTNDISIGEPIIISYSVLTDKSDTLLFQPKQDVISARQITKSGQLSSEGIDFEITHPFIDTFVFDHLKNTGKDNIPLLHGTVECSLFLLL